MRGGWNKTSKKIESEVVAMYVSGFQPMHISEKIGINKSTIDSILKRNNIKRKYKTAISAEATSRICGACKKIKNVSHFRFSQKYVKYQKYASTCIDCEKEYQKNHRLKKAAYYREYRRNWANNKRKFDIQYKISQNMRRRIRGVVKNKTNSSFSLLGCKIEFFLKHIESLFSEGMSWSNYGKHGWSLDHIIPCDQFDLTSENAVKKCFHWTNYQPMWASDNSRKRNNLVLSCY